MEATNQFLLIFESCSTGGNSYLVLQTISITQGSGGLGPLEGLTVIIMLNDHSSKLAFKYLCLYINTKPWFILNLSVPPFVSGQWLRKRFISDQSAENALLGVLSCRWDLLLPLSHQKEGSVRVLEEEAEQEEEERI